MPLNGDLRDIVIDDTCEYVYLTNGSLDRVEVFSIENTVFEAPIPVGPQPWGLDVTPDGSTIYVANFGANDISVVDTAARSELRKIHVPPSPLFDDKPLSLAIAGNGLALFSTSPPGISGSGVGRLWQLELASDMLTLRNDFNLFPGSPPRGGRTTGSTLLSASSDRSRIGIAVGNISNGPIFLYDTATDSFSDARLDDFLVGVALNEDGSMLLVGGRLRALDSDLALLGTSPVCSQAIALDPLRPVGYRAIQSRVDQVVLPGFELIQSFGLGDDSGNPAPPGCFSGANSSRMAISRDGRILAVITNNGFSLVRVLVTAVGGTVELVTTPDSPPAAPNGSDDSKGLMVVLGASAMVALAAGGWYARRRSQT